MSVGKGLEYRRWVGSLYTLPITVAKSLTIGWQQVMENFKMFVLFCGSEF